MLALGLTGCDNNSKPEIETLQAEVETLKKENDNLSAENRKLIEMESLQSELIILKDENESLKSEAVKNADALNAALNSGNTENDNNSAGEIADIDADALIWELIQSGSAGGMQPDMAESDGMSISRYYQVSDDIYELNLSSKPTVAIIDGIGVSQYELIYLLKTASYYFPDNLSPDELGRQAMDMAAQSRVLETVARERGYGLTDEDREDMLYQLDYIGKIASAEMSGEDYLRVHFGIDTSHYLKIMESQILTSHLMQDEYDQIVVREDDLRTFYEKNSESFEEATVRHILFFYEGIPGGDNPRTREEAEQLARDTVERIKAGEEMSGLVMELSEDNYLENEGVYVFSRNENYDTGFLQWTFFEPDRQVGDVGICETTYGYHVMRLEDMQIIPLEDVKDYIADAVKKEELDRIVEEWQNEPRFQIRINQGVLDSLVKQILGDY
jgi:hypothetical protein